MYSFLTIEGMLFIIIVFFINDLKNSYWFQRPPDLRHEPSFA
uniref:Uncharacterized protein n=1 Tax=Klebsiella pneumoniae TaxID=573 RepID=A0A8B0STJ3_KLEPN|nr:hypothetical protein [Klebsiella pneumoniae]